MRGIIIDDLVNIAKFRHFSGVKRPSSEVTDGYCLLPWRPHPYVFSSMLFKNMISMSSSLKIYTHMLAL